MSAPDTTVREATEAGSSVKLIRNARGEVQLEVRVAVRDTPTEVQSASDLAQAIFDGLQTKYMRSVTS